MIPHSVRFSTSAYRWLLRSYPPDYRQRFANEMFQVFGLLCRDRYQQNGPTGLAVLWLTILWDWGCTAASQWIRYLLGKRRGLMNTGLDKQSGDLVWSIATGLRAAYPIDVTIKVLAAAAPEPTASACKCLLAEFEKGLELNQALDNWQRAFPSTALTRLVALLKQAPQGSNLPDLLDPLGEALLHEFGSDPAFYAQMRREAEQLGAPVPARVLASNN
jgi:hypothetical protein